MVFKWLFVTSVGRSSLRPLTQKNKRGEREEEGIVFFVSEIRPLSREEKVGAPS